MRQGFRILLILQLFVAGAMAFWGMIIGIRPHMLLDVVLTQEELRVEKTRNVTLDLMQRAVGYDSTLCLIFALIIAGIATLGLWLHPPAAK
jgi:hypothetical protein